MNQWNQVGKLLLFAGLTLGALGGLLMLGSKLGGENRVPWIGNLPGDIRIQRKGFSCYFPLATSILVSLGLTLLLNVIVRLLRRP
jgi:hypothetical protein